MYFPMISPSQSCAGFKMSVTAILCPRCVLRYYYRIMTVL